MLTYAAALLLAALLLIPVLWLFVMSVSPAADLTAKPLRRWPETLDLSRYRTLLTWEPNTMGQAFLAAIRNSLVTAGIAVAAALVLAVPAAWAVSRNPRMEWSLYALILTYMLPPVALAVPLYLRLARLGLLNSTLDLALIYLSILAPFTAWLLKSVLMPSPRYRGFCAAGRGAAGPDSAHPDPAVGSPGAVHGDAFCAAPRLGRVLLRAAVHRRTARQDRDDRHRRHCRGPVADYGLIAAAGVLAALPPLLIGLLMKRAIVSGLTQGGVKG